MNTPPRRPDALPRPAYGEFRITLEQEGWWIFRKGMYVVSRYEMNDAGFTVWVKKESFASRYEAKQAIQDMSIPFEDNVVARFNPQGGEIYPNFPKVLPSCPDKRPIGLSD